MVSVEGKDLWIPRRCGEPWCTHCWRHRVGFIRDSLRAQTAGPLWGSHVWLYTRSTRNTLPMLSAFEELEKTREYWRQHAYYAQKVGKAHPWHLVEDWCGVVEVKMGRNGWNVHEHIILSASVPRLDYRSWADHWSKAARSLGGHTDLQKLRGSVSVGVHYITAYLTKSAVWGGLTREEAWRDQDCLRGRRFVRRKWGSAPPRVKSGIWERCCMPDQNGDCHDLWWEASGRTGNSP